MWFRGMSLGGRRITNDALLAHCEALGCGDVATFRASGNVIFESTGRHQPFKAKVIAASEASFLGPNTIRTKGTIDQIAAKHLC